MSVRLEWTTADYAGPSLHHHGAELADGNTVTHDVAVVIGSQVIEGTPESIGDKLRDALALLDSEASARRDADRRRRAVEKARTRYARDDIEIVDAAESVDGGYWVVGRFFIPAEDVEPGA